MINYVDRGAIASNGVNGSLETCTDSGICTSGSGIQGEFNLNNFQDGVLSSAFMVGLLLASPIFASLAKSHNPFRLIGVGLSVWTFAAAGCGSSFNFWSIAVFRMLVGVGEASFISLAAPFIDDNAPVAQKTAWLAMFYMCIPTGVAFGYVYGGLVGSYLNWRFAFWGEAILMLPFAVLGFVMKSLQLRGFADGKVKEASTSEDVSVPLDLLFAVITIICGIFGTLSGGYILDRMNATISNAFKLLSGATLLGAIFCFSTFCFRGMNIFLLLFAVGEILVFATQAPVNYVCLHSIKPSLRPLSMAISTVSIHIFGDMPSSPQVGVLQDHVDNWTQTSLILTSVFFLAAVVLFIGVFLNGVDRFNEDELSAKEVCTEPLLDGNIDETRSFEP